MKYKFLTPVKEKDEKILNRPEFRAPEEDEKAPKDDGTKVNYLKKPVSERGKMSFILSMAGLVLFLAALFLTYRPRGNPSMTVSAIAMSSLIFSAVSVLYGVLAFLQKNRNYLFAWIGLCAGGVEFITWIVTIIVGAAV